MAIERKTVIVAGASRGIGAAVTNLFLERDYDAVGNSRYIRTKYEVHTSDNHALVDGDIALPTTAGQRVRLALERFETRTP